MALIPLFVFGLFFLILGGMSAFFVWMAVTKNRRYRLLSDTRLAGIGALRPGLCKTTGLVRAIEEPIRSPMTRRDCVFYEFTVEEQRTRTVSTGNHGTRTETYWATVVHDRQYVRFSLEDDDGEVELDLKGAEVSMRSESRTSSSLFNEPPPRLERLLRDRYGTSTRGLLFNKTMRYSETVIEEADKLIALGEVRPKKRESRHLMTTGHDVPLIVSDKSDKDLAASYARSRNWYVVGACVPVVFLIPVAIVAAIFAGAMLSAGPGPMGVNNPPPANNAFLQPNPPPPPEKEFVAQALEDVRGPDEFKRGHALRRLANAPDGDKQRLEFDAARADAGRRKEVNDALMGVLKGDDQGNKPAAAGALKPWMTPDTVPEVAALLDKADRAEALRLIDVLGESKDVRAVPALARQLKPHHFPALRAVEKFGPAATPGLVAALDDEGADRVRVCQALEKVGTEEALPALRKLSEQQENRSVLLAARRAIKAIEGRGKK